MKRTPRLVAASLILFCGTLCLLLLLPIDGADDKGKVLRPRQSKAKEKNTVVTLDASDNPERPIEKIKSINSKQSKTQSHPSKAETQRFRGKIVDKNGRGVANCKVQINYDDSSYPRPPYSQYLEEDLRRLELKSNEEDYPLDLELEVKEDDREPCFQATTDAAGCFFIDLENPVEDEPVLSIQASEGYQRYCKKVITPRDRDLGEITLYPACGLSGIVVDGLGQGLSGVPVLLMKSKDYGDYLKNQRLQGHLSAYFITKEDGQFQFQNQDPGAYYLLAKSAKHIETQLPVTLEPGNSNATVTLRDSRELEITIIDSQNRGVPNLYVQLEDENRWPLKTPDSTSLITDKDGVARFSKLVHKEYQLTVSTDSDTIFEDSVAIDQELKTTYLSIRLPKKKTLTGSVLDSNGEPLTSGYIQLEYYGLTGKSYQSDLDIKLDQQGRYKVRNVIPGHYCLRAASINFMIAYRAAIVQKKLKVLPSDPEAIQIAPIRLPSTQKCLITVLGHDNRPKSGLKVQFFQDGHALDKIENPLTNAQGQISLEMLSPSPVQLLIYEGKRLLSMNSLELSQQHRNRATIKVPSKVGTVKVELTDHLGKAVVHGYLGLTLRGLKSEVLDDDPPFVGAYDPLIHNKGRVSIENVPVGQYQIIYEYQRGLFWKTVLLNEITVDSTKLETIKIQLPKLD